MWRFVLIIFLIVFWGCQTAANKQLVSSDRNNGEEFILLKGFAVDVENILKKTNSLDRFKVKPTTIF